MVDNSARLEGPIQSIEVLVQIFSSIRTGNREYGFDAMRAGRYMCRAGVLSLLMVSGVQAAPLVVDLDGVDCDTDPPFEINLLWDLGEAFGGRVELRVHSETGNLFAAGSAAGEARTGKWAVPGMRFFLLEHGTGSVLDQVVVEIPECRQDVPPPVSERRRAEPQSPRSQPPDRRAATAQSPPDSPLMPGQLELDERAVLKLSPPRLRYCGLPVERTTVNVEWDISALDHRHVQIYLNSLDGQLFAQGGPSGDMLTGEWVRNGTRFLLYLPEMGKVVAMKEFRILPCNVVEYPDEPEEDNGDE
jgi:hypothetical protein